MEPLFFATQAAWRKWLAKHHDKKTECLVGYWKKATGKPSVDWDQTVDEALCFGWIDGVRRSLGEESFTIRFTPRKAGSTWSTKNIKRLKELADAGLLHASGKAAFEGRDLKKASLSSHEQAGTLMLGPLEKAFRKHAKAWKAWQAMAPSYRKSATWWVISAKQEATRERRLALLISHSAKGEKVPPLRPRAAGAQPVRVSPPAA